MKIEASLCFSPVVVLLINVILIQFVWPMVSCMQMNRLVLVMVLDTLRYIHMDQYQPNIVLWLWTTRPDPFSESFCEINFFLLNFSVSTKLFYFSYATNPYIYLYISLSRSEYIYIVWFCVLIVNIFSELDVLILFAQIEYARRQIKYSFFSP